MSLDKPTDHEEEYFAKEDLRLRLGLKKTLKHDQAQVDLFNAIAKKVGCTTVESGEALHLLGFTADNVEILPLIPMLEIAWADDKMSFDESTLILDTARSRGLSSTSAAYAKLKELTESRPDNEFFEGCNRLFKEMLSQHGEEADKERLDVRTLMTQVANVSGGFFGLTSSVSDEEEKLISELITKLGL